MKYQDPGTSTVSCHKDFVATAAWEIFNLEERVSKRLVDLPSLKLTYPPKIDPWKFGDSELGNHHF